MKYWITINEKKGYANCFLWAGYKAPEKNDNGEWESDYFDFSTKIYISRGDAMRLVDGPLENGTITELSITKILPS